jgi:hypothetical protein
MTEEYVAPNPLADYILGVDRSSASQMWCVVMSVDRPVWTVFWGEAIPGKYGFFKCEVAFDVPWHKRWWWGLRHGLRWERVTDGD